MANNQRGTGPVDINQLSDRLKEVDFAKVWKDLRGRFSKWFLIVLAIIALLVIIIILLVPFSHFYTDALWYNHLGFQNLFWKMFWAKILMAVIFGIIFFAILYINIVAARKLVPQQKLDIAGSPLEEFVKRAGSAWSRIVKWALLAFAIIAAGVAGISWGGKWELVLRFLNHSSFGVKDPIFHKDAGFYMFSYPFQRELVSWLIGTLFFVLVITVLVYILQGGIRLRRGPDMLAPHVKLHLSILLAVIFLLKAWSYRLNMYDLLFRKDGVVQGVGYPSANARIPALWILLVISILAAIVLLINVRYKGWLLPVIAVGSLIVVTIVAGTIYPAIIQTYVVKPNEQKLESKYIQNNIDFTRMGYKLNKIQALPFAAEQNLTAADIAANRATIRNVRLWDPTPLLDAHLAFPFALPDPRFRFESALSLQTPPDDFLPKLRELCTKHGIMLIIDEVQSGFGRTGKMLAMEHWNVAADITTMAKGIASGVPFGVFTAPAEIMDWPVGVHGNTYGGNLLSCTAALKTIELIEGGLMENAAKVGEHMMNRINEWPKKFKNVGCVRGKGLMIGVELVLDKNTKEPAAGMADDVAEKGFQKGILLLPCGKSTVRLAPPLVITTKQADYAMDVLEGIFGA